jgi:hypothetical protein
VDEDLIAAALRLDPHSTRDGYRSHGEAVIAAFGDLQAFVERWRRHFVEVMKPSYMPENWRVDRKVDC